MPIRLLSFLNDIEQALVKQSASEMGPTWQATRMVSYHQSLARMVLQPAPDSAPGTPAGGVFLQSFLLSDGTPCLKATLNWEGSPTAPVIAVYAKPELDWKAEARRIAVTWFAGPPAVASVVAVPSMESMVAEAPMQKLESVIG